MDWVDHFDNEPIAMAAPAGAGVLLGQNLTALGRANLYRSQNTPATYTQASAIQQ
jgi:hypothetical protein